MAVYLDCNATTPVSSGVAEVVMRYMTEEYGNSGSRTHEFGVVAKQAVERARGQVAAFGTGSICGTAGTQTYHHNAY